jgi:aryl-alcohol dehydrogenase-like predicted oxidoreductase
MLHGGLGCRFVLSHPLVASAVIGATSAEQLRQQLDAAEQGPLGGELMQEVDAIHQRYPNPTP